MLINPYSALDWKPALRDHWSERFIAVECDVGTCRTLVCNIYVPNQKRALREAFLVDLMGLDLQGYDLCLFGGDWNCTQHPLDRTGPMRSHFSTTLDRFLVSKGLVDTLGGQLQLAETDAAAAHFQLKTHTRWYGAQGRPESARLDRWYVTAAKEKWIKETRVTEGTKRSDHLGVIIAITDPNNPVYYKASKRLYPPPSFAEPKIKEAVLQFLNGPVLSAVAGTSIPDQWDEAKLRLEMLIKRTTRECKRKSKASYRKKVQQLHKQLKALGAVTMDPQRTRTEGQQLRSQLARLRDEWQARVARAKAGRWIVDGRENSAASFERICLKKGDRTIVSVDPTPGFPRRQPKDIANAFADGWVAILDRPDHTPTERRRWHAAVEGFLAYNGPRISTSQRHALAAPIEESEIIQAINALQRSKACGPDNLPNDFYKDYVEVLAPILAVVLNACWLEGVTIASANAAVICPLKKAGSSADPLAYRPIALLNADYKIWTKVLSARLRTVLPSLVHPEQFGFVPKRTIHDAIDILSAAFNHGIEDEDPADPGIALLLDFAKAYDSLSRPFLLKVLRRLGLPSRFIQMVKATHAHTTCRFRVNGLLSRPVNISTGIRQGCPLAPLLFILALEPLARQFHANPDILGIRLRGSSRVIKLSSYADDTTLYLRAASCLKECLRVLELFAELSGLRVNPSKSVAIRLNPMCTLEHVGPFSCLRQGDWARYLGVYFGVGDPRRHNWAIALKGIRTRMGIASSKLLTASQRSAFAAAIIVPKVTFLARHIFPTASDCTRLACLIDNFIWSGTFSIAGRDGRAGLGRDLAIAKRSEGGLARPDIKAILTKMASKTVLRWCYRPPSIAYDAQCVLVRAATHARQPLQLLLAPTGGRASTRYAGNLWTTGMRMLRGFVTENIYNKNDMRQGSASRLRTLETIATSPEAVWTSRNLAIDCRGYTKNWRRTRDAWDPRWIKRCPLKLLDDPKWTTLPVSPGLPLSLFRGCKTVQEVTGIRWVAVGRLIFTPVRRKAIGSTAFVTFCLKLISNFPELLFPWDPPSVLKPLPATASNLDFSWELRRGADRVEYSVQHWTQAPIFRALDSAYDMRQLHELLPPRFERPQAVLLHPDASPFFWPFAQISTPTTAKVVATAGLRQLARSREAIAQALEGWTKAAECGHLFRSLDWKRLASTQSGLSVGETDFWRRLRLRRLPVWRPDGGAPCGRHECSSRTSDAYEHIFWTCPAAQELWASTTIQWGRRDTFPTTRWKAAICSGSMDEFDFPVAQCALQLLHNINVKVSPELHLLMCDLAHQVANRAWLVAVTTGLRLIWFQRNTRIHDPARGSDSTLLARHQSAMQRRLQTDKDSYRFACEGLGRRAAQALMDAVLHQVTVPTCVVPDGIYQARWSVLFFDGGSRGNPGPGGAGACVVSVDAGSAAVIEWAQAVFLPDPTTTNNVAEFTALLSGLQFLRQAAPPVCTIIGDSQLVISLLRQHKPPKAKHLRDIYRRARRAADQLHINEWRHHLRAHNAMADALANYAMDTQSTTTLWPTRILPSTNARRQLLTMLQSYCATDLQPWLLHAADWRPP